MSLSSLTGLEVVKNSDFIENCNFLKSDIFTFLALEIEETRHT